MRGYLVIPKLMYVKVFWLKAGRRAFLRIVIQIVSVRSQFYILLPTGENGHDKNKKAAIAALGEQRSRLKNAL
jgi:hypothetical protein